MTFIILRMAELALDKGTTVNGIGEKDIRKQKKYSEYLVPNTVGNLILVKAGLRKYYSNISPTT